MARVAASQLSADQIDRLERCFPARTIALVADGRTFYGLVTRVDLLNHLRRSLT